MSKLLSPMTDKTTRGEKCGREKTQMTNKWHFDIPAKLEKWRRLVLSSSFFSLMFHSYCVVCSRSSSTMPSVADLLFIIVVCAAKQFSSFFRLVTRVLFKCAKYSTTKRPQWSLACIICVAIQCGRRLPLWASFVWCARGFFFSFPLLCDVRCATAIVMWECGIYSGRQRFCCCHSWLNCKGVQNVCYFIRLLCTRSVCSRFVCFGVVAWFRWKTTLQDPRLVSFCIACRHTRTHKLTLIHLWLTLKSAIKHFCHTLFIYFELLCFAFATDYVSDYFHR